jgi:hypothetical protein
MDLLWKHFQSMTPVQDKILGIHTCQKFRVVVPVL